MELSSDDLILFYENEAEHVPIFGSLREISLAEHIMSVLPKINQQMQVSCIDIGCGEGYVLYRLQKKYPSLHLTGLDLSTGRLKTTKQHVPHAQLLKGDVLALPFQNKQFDIVICSELLEHVEEYTKVVDELLRVTKHTLIITVPNELPLVRVMCPKCKTKHYYDGHVNFFTAEKLRSLFINKAEITIKSLRTFHSIFTYNRVTIKFPFFLRFIIDQFITRLHKYVSFFKPNYLLIAVEKKNSK